MQAMTKQISKDETLGIKNSAYVLRKFKNNYYLDKVRIITMHKLRHNEWNITEQPQWQLHQEMEG